ncbi:MAG: hypothetical protein KGQ79_05570 [Proteobacteria bacterium]|nr:hypothetical protein [Pseudomonadota bacterium]
MSILHNIAVSLRPRLFAREVTILTVQTTPRIAECVKPVIEMLIRPDRAGETYRCAVALWHRWDAPTLNVYLGTASLCRVDGPSTSDERGYRPAGGLVETPGLTAHLSPDEAHDLDNRIKVAIETTIRQWADETMCGRWKITPQHQYRGAADA